MSSKPVDDGLAGGRGAAAFGADGLALLLEVNVMVAVFAGSLLVSMLLLVLQKRGDLSSDTLLGLLSHSTGLQTRIELSRETCMRHRLLPVATRVRLTNF